MNTTTLNEIPDWCLTQIGVDDLQRIRQAVAQVEKNSSIEVVPVIARGRLARSADRARSLALGVLALGFFPPIFDAAHALLMSETLAIVGIAATAISIMVAAQRLTIFQSWFVNSSTGTALVHARAQVEFYRLGLESTSGRSGILLYLSLSERQAVVLADKTVAIRVDENTWQGVLKLIVGGAKSQGVGSGLVAAIEECGRICCSLFPSNGMPKNELKNDLRFVD